MADPTVVWDPDAHKYDPSGTANAGQDVSLTYVGDASASGTNTIKPANPNVTNGYGDDLDIEAGTGAGTGGGGDLTLLAGSGIPPGNITIRPGNAILTSDDDSGQTILALGSKDGTGQVLGVAIQADEPAPSTAAHLQASCITFYMVTDHLHVAFNNAGSIITRDLGQLT